MIGCSSTNGTASSAGGDGVGAGCPPSAFRYQLPLRSASAGRARHVGPITARRAERGELIAVGEPTASARRPVAVVGELAPRLLLPMLLLALGGCAFVDASHPLDPDAPRSQQAKATLTGRLELPEGADAAALREATVQLTEEGASAPAHEVTPELTGAFRISSITPGTYVLDVAVPGFEPASRSVTLTLAQTADLGDVTLTALDTRGTVTGTVELAGRGAVGGVVVEAATGEVATTGADGTFTLELPAGGHRLRFRFPGYVTAEAEIDVTTDQTTTLDPITLQPRPGGVEGTVRMGRFDSAARRLTATVDISGPSDQQVTPDEAGDFGVTGLTPGTYTVRVSAPGYAPRTRSIAVQPGETATAGTYEMTHLSETGDAVTLAGRVTVAGAPRAGATVDVRFVAVGGALATLTTDADGAFTTPAAPDERYTLAVMGAGVVEVERGPFTYDLNSGDFVDEQGMGTDLAVEQSCAAAICPAGTRCDPGPMRCVAGCAADSDCPDTQYCDDAGACADGCRDTEGCPDDHTCIDHACVPD